MAQRRRHHSLEPSGPERAQPLPPWHMWGTTVRAQSIASPGVLNQTSTQQIVRVNYKRPETWSFFFGAKLVGGELLGGAGLAVLRIEVLFGVGRSVFDSRQNPEQGPGRTAFCVFSWDFAGLVPDPIPDAPFATKYTNRVVTPPLIDEDLTTQQTLEWLPAQDIQIASTLQHNKTDPLQTLDIDVTAFMAPRTHVRPDWFRGGHFRGEEQGGT